VLLCGAVPAVAAALLALYRPGLFRGVDSSVYDTVVRRAALNPPSGQVVIVDVDERSLAAYGQWPWRRDVLGRLIDRLRAMGAATIALDVMFAEPDRHAAPADLVGATEPSGASTGTSSGAVDAAFADTLRAGRVVLGYAVTFDAGGTGAADCVLHPSGVAIVQPAEERMDPPFFRASGAICNLPVLARAAGASGFLNATPDSDGILRRMPLLLELDGRVYPALALAALISARSTSGLTLRVANVDTASLRVGDVLAPLDGKSNLLLRYRGKKKTFPYISAADVLADRVPAGTFQGKLAFVGATALGTRDVVVTPFDTQFAGVEVQATVADNLVQQDFIRRPASAVALEAQAALALGLLLALVAGRNGLTWACVACLACLAFVWGGAVWLVTRHGLFLSPLFPTIGLTGSLVAMTVARVLTERRRAEWEGSEKTISQQLMIQSLLSLTEVRDLETGRHSRRTQRYARLLAEQLATNPSFRDDLTPPRVDLLARLAPLHDIGKVGVPDRLLNKTGKLTGEEFEEMKKHPARGHDVIVRAERDVGARDDVILAMAKEIVYTHHEWWDGSGYPQGLRGGQIPVAGRLMALVDVYDALVSKRVYRDALSQDEAIAIIVRGRGTQFDPAIVDAFLQVAEAFRRESER
jgi:HD-GYP domain-containing protein (c-di-GMP phosphodiesterase class II)